MIELAIMIGVIRSFVKTAKSKGQSGVVWGIIAAISYYGPVLVFGRLIYPEMIRGSVNSSNVSAYVILGVVLDLAAGIGCCWLVRRVQLSLGSDHLSEDQPLAELTGGEAEECFQRGVAAYDADQYDQALAEFNLAVRLKRGYAEAYLYRGLTESALNRNSQAIADLDTVSQIDPQNAEAYYWRGVIYAETNEQTKAREALDKAVQLGLEPTLRQEADKLIDQIRSTEQINS
jgi:tetratricopeptide (TPR) repeat protein